MRISVVIPSYNYCHFLRRAVDSVLAQSEKTEVIVVDDGSTDATPEIMASLLRERSDANLRYIRQANAGPSAARNHGVAAAGGDWVAFLDADDYWYPGKLASQVRFAVRNPGGALYFAGVDMENMDGLRRRWLPRKEGAFSWSEIVAENAVPSPTPLLSIETFERAGRFDENRWHAEDWDLWLRMAEIAPLIGQREALACYTDHGSGLHRNEKMLAASWEVMTAALLRGQNGISVALTEKILAPMVGSEAFLAAGQHDFAHMAQCAFQAMRMDPHQIPRMAWCGLYALVERSGRV